MKLNCQKHLFSLDDDLHYLNSAYKTPLLKSAEEAAKQALIRNRNPQRIAPVNFFDQSKLVVSQFAKLLYTSSLNIAIIPSTSYGFSTLLQNIKGKPKGNAITLGEEFPSGYFALKKWCDSQEQALEIIKSDDSLTHQGEDWNRRILEAINTKTSVVCISAIHWSTGLKYDLEQIGAKCALVGAKFLIDGAQTIGALPVDVKKCQIDGLVCAAYKCLYGPYSMSLMYVHDDFFDGQPLEEAWMNREGAEQFSSLSDYNETYMPGARRFNVGQTSNFVLTPILLSGLRQVNAWGVSHIQDYCSGLAKPFVANLKAHGFTFEEDSYFCSHLFSIKVDAEKMPQTMVRLKENKVKLSIRGSYLRISISVFNDKNDLDALANALIDVY